MIHPNRHDKRLTRFLNSEQGSALITTLFVVIIITSTLLAVLSMQASQYQLLAQKSIRLQARYSAESALQMQLARWRRQDFLMESQQHSRRVFDSDSAVVTVNPNGALPLISSRAWHKNRNYRFSTFLVRQHPPQMDYGIVVNPVVDELIVAGDTRLYGDVMVGKRGVRKQLINGQPYSGEQLVYGQTTRTTIDNRPQVDRPALRAIYHSLRQQGSAIPDGDFDFSVYAGGDTINFSGKATAVVLSLTDDLEADRPMLIRGPLILIAERPVRISGPLRFENDVRFFSSAEIIFQDAVRLNDVMVFSPQVTIIDCSTRFTQVFAEQQIELAGASIAGYPTLLCLFDSHNDGQLLLTGSCRLDGWAVLAEKIPEQKRTDNLVWIGPDAEMNGLVYSENRTTFEGIVNGTIITDTFYFYDSPTGHTNWINGGRLYRDQVRSPFHIPIFFEGDAAGLTTLTRWSF